MNNHLQLSLLTEPLDPYQQRIDATLLSALHSYIDAEQRWDKWRKRGLNDAEIKQAIAYEFGIFGGASHPEWHCYAGEKNPRFWLSISHAGKPTLSGKALIKQVRYLLKIPYRNENHDE